MKGLYHFLSKMGNRHSGVSDGEGVGKSRMSESWVSDDTVSKGRVSNNTVSQSRLSNGGVGDGQRRVGDDGGMVHSNRGMVHSNRGVSNNIDRGRSVVASHSLIGDLLGDSITIVSILHSLDPAVRESHAVAAGGGIAVPLLVLGELGSAVVIIDTIVVGVDWGLCQITGSLHNDGGSILRSSDGSSHEGGDDEDLHVSLVYVLLNW